MREPTTIELMLMPENRAHTLGALGLSALFWVLVALV